MAFPHISEMFAAKQKTNTLVTVPDWRAVSENPGASDPSDVETKLVDG
jgi:hypothetical protein